MNQTQKYLADLGNRIPEKLRKGSIQEVKQYQEEAEQLRQASKNPKLRKEQAEFLEKSAHDAFQRTAQVVDEKKAREIDRWMDHQVKDAIAKGKIPPPKMDEWQKRLQKKHFSK